MSFGDLRSILHYVPQFRGATFVVALDGAVIDSPDFSSILLDLAVLRSLTIRVVLVHGAAAQIEALGEKRGVVLSNADGTGITDEATLELSMDAISRLGSSLMQSLTTVRIRAASANAVHAHPAGILDGENAGFTGTIDRIDAEILRGFLDQDILPVVPPLAFDSGGRILRVNSDAVAREIALALGAQKIIFLSRDDPARHVDVNRRQMSCDEAGSFLDARRSGCPSGFVSKIEQARRAVRDGVPRVHLVGSERDDALLGELFSNEGIGLMIYADAYLKVRSAQRSDIDELRLMMHQAVEDQQILERTRGELLDTLDDFVVLEIDGNIVGCVAVHAYDDPAIAELACLFVKRGHSGQGYGQTLVQAACDRARRLGFTSLFALSTQAAGYLERAGFRRCDEIERLPPSRREKYEGNRRNAILLLNELAS